MIITTIIIIVVIIVIITIIMIMKIIIKLYSHKNMIEYDYIQQVIKYTTKHIQFNLT